VARRRDGDARCPCLRRRDPRFVVFPVFPPPRRSTRVSLIMFRKLDVQKLEQTKSSVARGIRGRIAEQYPQLEQGDVLDALIPKKAVMTIAKTPEKNCVIVVDGVPLFFQLRDGPYFPTLKVLHQYPNMMPRLQTDKGAIRFIFQGANILCPGLTSSGAKLPDTNVEENTPVAIYAEGKTHALAVGITKMSTDDIKAINKNVGVDTVHHLNDGLWKTTRVES
jgi:PUA domain protein